MKTWRANTSYTRHGDTYPTHGLGPLCQLLSIHRGDRLKYLVCVETGSINAKAAYAINHDGDIPEPWRSADQTSTLIVTENKATILLDHCTRLPRPYDRAYKVCGTKAYACKYPVPMYSIPEEFVPDKAFIPEGNNGHVVNFMGEDEVARIQAFFPSRLLTKDLEDIAKKVGGHGGMDYLMDYRLIYCLRHGLPLDLDVYDLAEWSCISPLTALSLDNNSCPVEIPDFTRGFQDVVKGYQFAFAEGDR